MSGRVVPPNSYSFSQIENLAEAYLRFRDDVPERIPIDIELMLETTPNVDLQIEAGLLHGYNVEGCVCNELLSPLITVLVEKRIADGTDLARYLAVIGEELGHIQLHHNVIRSITSIEDFLEVRSNPDWRQMERDAKQWSAAVRMPRREIVSFSETYYARIVRELGFGAASTLEKHLCSHLASLFQVPMRDMNARLRQFPCAIYDRLARSAAAQSDILLPSEWGIEARPPQQLSLTELWGEDSFTLQRSQSE